MAAIGGSGRQQSRCPASAAISIRKRSLKLPPREFVLVGRTLLRVRADQRAEARHAASDRRGFSNAPPAEREDSAISPGAGREDQRCLLFLSRLPFARRSVRYPL